MFLKLRHCYFCGIIVFLYPPTGKHKQLNRSLTGEFMLTKVPYKHKGIPLKAHYLQNKL